MKTHRLVTTLTALLGAVAFAAETKSSSGSSSVTVHTTDGQGKAVITIDINGRKETREIDLGNATKIEIRADEDGGEKKERATYLGVAMSEMPAALGDQLGLAGGVVVGSVVPGSPAEKAGLQKNDVLVRFGDERLKDPRQLQELVTARKEGDKVTLHFIRRAQPGSVEITLGSEERGVDRLLDFTRTWKPAAGEWLQDAVGKGFGIHRKVLVLGPDGQVIERDPAAQMREAVESVEKALHESKVGEKTLDAVRDALNSAVRALDQAREAKDGGAAAAETARIAANEAREKAEQIRREVEERVKNALREKNPDASGVRHPEPKIEKDR